MFPSIREAAEILQLNCWKESDAVKKITSKDGI
jgi:hypothetical protein